MKKSLVIGIVIVLILVASIVIYFSLKETPRDYCSKDSDCKIDSCASISCVNVDYELPKGMACLAELLADYCTCENNKCVGHREFCGSSTYASCDDEEFCGSSTYASCDDDTECKAGGCSGQVCEGKDESTITTCEFKKCYNDENYGVECKCSDNQCQWV